jgi:hypothetical protein
MKSILHVTIALAMLPCILSAQNVGIGTQTPLARLHVSNGSVLAISDQYVIPEFAAPVPYFGTAKYLFWYADKGAFRSTNDDVGMRKDSIGYYSFAAGSFARAQGVASAAVGLATSAGGDQAFAGGAYSTANNFASFAYGNQAKASGYASLAIGEGAIARNANEVALGKYNDTSNTNQIFSIGVGYDNVFRSNIVTVLSNGRIGIGTTTPASRLHVAFPSGTGAGQVVLEEQGDAADGARLTFKNSARTDKNWDLYGLTNNTAANARFNFFYNGYGDVMNLTGDGRVGIGLSAPTASLQVRSASNFAVPQLNLQVTADSYSRLRMSNTINTTPWWDIAGLTHASTSGSAVMNFFYSQNGTTGVDVLSLKGNGNAAFAGTVTANGVTLTSDERLKKDITPINDVMPQLEQLSGYQYHWKDESRDASLQTGLLAQEVEKVLPQLVKTDEHGMKSVNYNGLIPYLLEAVKTLKAEVEALKKQ